MSFCRFCRFCLVFCAIGGAVLLLHDDANAGPATPSTVTRGVTLSSPATLPLIASASGASMQESERSARGSSGSRGFLGVSVTGMTDQLRQTFEVPEGVGVMIEEVEAGSPAEAARLRAGDVVVSFDGEDIESGSQLARAIRTAGADSTIALGFYRNGRYRQESVTLAPTPEGRVASFGPDVRADWDERDWEEWGERFGEEMAARMEALGAQWEARGEDWEAHGEEWERHWEAKAEEWEKNWENNAEHWEEFGERWAEFGERWGEWGAQFGEHWAEWGANFGAHMADWGANFGQQFAELGERLEAKYGDRELTEAEKKEVAAEVERAMEEIDWDQFETQIEDAFDSVEWEAMQRDLNAQLDSVDWEAMNRNINNAVRQALRSLEEAGILVERSDER